MKNTQWLKHKAQKTEVMSEALPLTEGLAHFYKMHFKYKFITGKQVASTGATFTPTLSIAQPPDLVFRSLVFLSELGFAHLQGWHHSRIMLMQQRLHLLNELHPHSAEPPYADLL